MKKHLYFTLVALFFSLSMAALADGPPPPPGNPSSGGGGGGPVGAPIDGGLGILLAMGVAYGARKLYVAKRSEKSDEEMVADQER